MPVMKRIHVDSGFSLIELLVAMLIIGVLAGMALPMIDTSVSSYRLRNESKNLARLVALAKMRATSQFTRARVAGVLGTGQYRLQVWNRTTSQWVTEGQVYTMGGGVRFGFGALDTPPPNSQPEIALSGECTANDSLATIEVGTSCVTFNSRGIPVNNVGDPLGGNAFYLTDAVGVRAITVTATPLIREWWSAAHSPNWVRQ
jgi:prepilin-type N-terminal cleavage/methylation domain-containing protein